MVTWGAIEVLLRPSTIFSVVSAAARRTSSNLARASIARRSASVLLAGCDVRKFFPTELGVEFAMDRGPCFSGSRGFVEGEMTAGTSGLTKDLRVEPGDVGVGETSLPPSMGSFVALSCEWQASLRSPETWLVFAFRSIGWLSVLSWFVG